MDQVLKRSWIPILFMRAANNEIKIMCIRTYVVVYITLNYVA